MSQYARLLKQTWKQVNEYVNESARVYQTAMEKRDITNKGVTSNIMSTIHNLSIKILSNMTLVAEGI